MPPSLLQRVIAKAVRVGATGLAVESRDGYDDVFVVSGGVGVSIARLASGGRAATALRGELLALRRKKATVTVGDVAYEIRSRAYDNFGDTAFEVRRRRV